MPTERRLAAIMFTDIVGYTALMAADEASGHRVRARQGEILRPLVEEYGGEWISHVGDDAPIGREENHEVDGIVPDHLLYEQRTGAPEVHAPNCAVESSGRRVERERGRHQRVFFMASA